jgi:lipopolysaccharide export system protein LptA
MRRFLSLCIFLLLGSLFSINAQNGGQPVTVMGDSMAGSVVNGESVREVIGHVVLKQGNVVITCNRAVQYLGRNNAILDGNVLVRQDTLTIRAQKGYYYGNQRIAECNTGVQLNDGKVILSAVNGNYYFKEQRAYFSDNVMLYDTVSTLTCKKLNYYKNENRAVAVGNVKITDSLNTIVADSMVHLRGPKITFAEHNVKITNTANNITVFGDHLENYSQKKYTLINENPLLIQIDTTQQGKTDTLVISSKIMESFSDSSGKFIATDSVRIVQGGFASSNNYSIYYRQIGKIITYKKSGERIPPVMWYENSQLSGDSVNIFLVDNRLSKIHVLFNGFILSQNKTFAQRFDQISGDSLTIYFDSTGINHTDVFGNVLSIYYTYEEDSPNGLIKASAQRAKFLFKNKAVSDVKLYSDEKHSSSVISEYYPENLVDKNELSFTIPAFIIFKGRPEKNDLLNKNRIFSGL